jgi:hypothetical protein
VRRKPPSHKYQRGTLNQRYGSSSGLYDRAAFYQRAARALGEAMRAPSEAGLFKDLAATFNRFTLPDHYRGRHRGTLAAIELLRSDPMKRSTVDLVVTGDERAAAAAAVDAVRRGQRVLVVLRSGNSRVMPRVRRLCRGANGQLIGMTNAEVVCVDGVDAVEAVVVRYRRTGHLCAVNTPAFMSCDVVGTRVEERDR